MSYMYPIIIKREPQIIRYQKEFDLSNVQLSLKVIRKYVSETESFSINELETGRFSSKIMLYVNGQRLETKKELNLRVKKEEAYMKNYTKFHSSKK